jgi:hypothetical protein
MSVIHVWGIDPKEGGDYRFLARNYGVLVIRPDRLKCNPFTAIQNVPYEMLRESIAEVTADSFGVYDASEGLIATHVQRVFDQHEKPSLLDFVASLQSEKVKYGGRKQGYLDSLNTRLTKAQISLGGIINCREDYFSRLYDRDVIFEVGSLSGSAQRVLVPWIIMKLVLYKIKNPTPYLSHILIFDEAQSQIWSRVLEMRGRTSYMATLATQCRAFGLGIIVLAQNPATKLMTEIIANSAIKLCFHLGSGEEVFAMSKHMGLTYDQMDVLHHLKKGEAICRVGLGYTEPVRLEVFDFQDEAVSDDELNEIMKPHYDKLLEGIEPAKSQLSGKSTSNRTSEKHSGRKQSSVSGKIQLDSGLSGNEESYLRIVSSHPMHTPMEIYARLNDEKVMGNGTMSQATSVKTRKGLIRKGYLESFDVLGTGRSGKMQCDVVTEKAGISVSNPRGGNLHSFWCHRVGEYFKGQGEKVILGDTVSGNEIDLSAGKLGIEIVVNTLVIENLERHLRIFDEILILCIDNKKKREIEKKIADLILKPIRVDLLKNFFITL